jgi:hypothetical protein
MSYAIDVIAVATGPVAAFAVAGDMLIPVRTMAHAIAQETMRLKSFLCFNFPMMSSSFLVFACAACLLPRHLIFSRKNIQNNRIISLILHAL